MTILADANTLPTCTAYEDLPAAGPFNGYRCIVLALNQVALWNGSAWVFSPVVSPAGVVALDGTLTGTVTGIMADVSDIALSTANTYTDAAVNTAVNAAILEVNLELKELQTKLNELIAALK